jgi:hypothetical protein
LDDEFGDPTYGGITARHRQLVVVGTKRQGEAMELLGPEDQVFEVSEEAPGVVQVQPEDPDSPGPYLVPLAYIDAEDTSKLALPAGFGGPVAGGNFAGTADPRWSKLGEEFGRSRLDVVAVHDRIENIWKYQISTTGKANLLGFWDYDRDAPLSCPACGWAGSGAGHENAFQDLLDVRCPACDEMLLVVNYPTLVETRVAAAAGDRRAQAELANVDATEARAERAAALELKEPSQLPDLAGERLVIVWDFEDRDDEKWTVLRHGDEEIWRELAYYEGYRRFAEVFEILRARYGSRLAEVRPTPASGLYLYGDKTPPPHTVEELNASLNDTSNWPLSMGQSQGKEGLKSDTQMTMTTAERTLDERWEAVHRAILAGPGREDQELIDSGQAWHIKGSVGRRCMSALQNGAAVLPAEQVRDFYDNVVPSYRDVKDEIGSTGSVANCEASLET